LYLQAGFSPSRISRTSWVWIAPAPNSACGDF